MFSKLFGTLKGNLFTIANMSQIVLKDEALGVCMPSTKLLDFK